MNTPGNQNSAEQQPAAEPRAAPGTLTRVPTAGGFFVAAPLVSTEDSEPVVTVNTTGAGGVVTNPMTADLDIALHSLTHVGLIQFPDVNNAANPVININNYSSKLHFYSNFGSVSEFLVMDAISGSVGFYNSSTYTIALATVQGGTRAILGVDPSGTLLFSNDGGGRTMTLSQSGKLTIGGVQNFLNNAAAIAGGLVVGDVYRNGDVLQIVH
jgi:hypothetical protein